MFCWFKLHVLSLLGQRQFCDIELLCCKMMIVRGIRHLQYSVNFNEICRRELLTYSQLEFKELKGYYKPYCKMIMRKKCPSGDCMLHYMEITKYLKVRACILNFTVIFLPQKYKVAFVVSISSSHKTCIWFATLSLIIIIMIGYVFKTLLKKIIYTPLGRI